MAGNPKRNPPKRHGTYPDQKPIHPSDISFSTFSLAPNQIKKFFLNGRSFYLPILKKVTHSKHGNIWTDAIGEVAIFFDEKLEYIFFENVSECTLLLKVKIV